MIDILGLLEDEWAPIAYGSIYLDAMYTMSTTV